MIKKLAAVHEDNQRPLDSLKQMGAMARGIDQKRIRYADRINCP